MFYFVFNLFISYEDITSFYKEFFWFDLNDRHVRYVYLFQSRKRIPTMTFS